MEENKRSRIGKKLVVISHTEHFMSDGLVTGWAPTINELNYLADYWDEVVHLACLYSKPAPNSSVNYTKKNIRFVALPTYGGKSLLNKTSVILKMPVILKRIQKEISNADFVQLRLPTAMGVYLLPFFAWFTSRNFKLWVKYAGNWNQTKPPLSYRFQRWFLKADFCRCKVTINGIWENQSKHCISFENPCLNNSQLEIGLGYSRIKEFDSLFKLVFVGRLENSKGVSRILDALNHIDLTKIKEIVFIGDGPENHRCKLESERKDVKIRMTGFLTTDRVHEELMDAHFLLLPSDSEGFPKVIAEAACYGVIPIVSDVGSISHFINEQNGFVYAYKEREYAFNFQFKMALSTSEKELQIRSTNVNEMARLFTFDHYYDKLVKLIF